MITTSATSATTTFIFTPLCTNHNNVLAFDDIVLAFDDIDEDKRVLLLVLKARQLRHREAHCAQIACARRQRPGQPSIALPAATAAWPVSVRAYRGRSGATA